MVKERILLYYTIKLILILISSCRLVSMFYKKYVYIIMIQINFRGMKLLIGP